jgi:hypothetical protein
MFRTHTDQQTFARLCATARPYTEPTRVSHDLLGLEDPTYWAKHRAAERGRDHFLQDQFYRRAQYSGELADWYQLGFHSERLDAAEAVAALRVEASRGS